MFYERIYAEEIQDKDFCCKCSLNADLSLEMKSYHGKDKQFVQQPVLVFHVCAYRLVTFFTMADTRGPSRRRNWREKTGKITRGAYTGARTEWCVGATAYKH